MRKRFGKVISTLMVMTMVMGLAVGCSKDPVAESDTAADTESTSDEAADSSSSDSSTGTVFTYGLEGDPTETVNVLTTSDRYGLMTVKMVYSPLYMYNADGINWFLATEYETEDNMTYTMKLREDVVWSDGESFTADDVVFTYTEMEDADNLGWAYSQLVYEQGAVEVTKVDDYTVTFTFPYETATGLEMLSGIFIMPEHIYSGVEDYEHNDYNMNTVGTGPYQITEYETGSYVKFEANATYFEGTPSIDTYVYRIIENSDTAILALQTGEIDAYQALPSAVEKLDLEANNLTAYSYSEGRIGYMMINCNQVTDQTVREAILYALDKAEMSDAAYVSSDYYLTPYTFLPVDNQFYTEDVEKYEQDLEKSMELLEEAGATGLTLTLGYVETDDAQSAQALLIQEQLAEVGITVELSSNDSTAMSTAMKDPDNEYDMYLSGYIMGIDPDTFSSIFDSGAAYNYMYYENDTISALFEEGRTTFDTEEKMEIYAELQAEVLATAAFYPIVSNNKTLLVNNRVQGVEEAGLVPVYTFEDTSYLEIVE